jgi:hypothetical protein
MKILQNEIIETLVPLGALDKLTIVKNKLEMKSDGPSK